MGLIESFDWAMRKALARVEDPPEEPRMVDCRRCESHGFVFSEECGVCQGVGRVPDECEGEE